MKKEKGLIMLELIILVLIISVTIGILIIKKKNMILENSTIQSVYRENRATYIPRCQAINFKSMLENSDKYINNDVVVTGEVVQVVEENNTVFLKVNITPITYEYLSDVDYVDSIVVVYKYNTIMNLHIKDGDVITLYGEYKGIQSYGSMFGTSFTAPMINAMYIDVH